MAKRKKTTKKKATKKKSTKPSVSAFPSDAELRKALDGDHPDIAPSAALRTLAYRSAPKIGATMLKIAKDSKQQAVLRTTAAVQLGRSGGAANRKALMTLLGSEDAGVTRRAAEGLGRIGDAAALGRLRALRPRDPVVQRAVETAKTLLCYRLGEKSGRLKAPEARQILQLGTAKARNFELEAVSAADLKAISSTLAAELPELPVATKGALQMDCGQGNYLIVFNKELGGKDGLDRLAQSSTVMGAVMKRADVDGTYYVDTYLLSHPSAGKSARLFAMKPSGVVTYYGSLATGAGGVDFTLQALNTRYSQPIDLAGHIAPRTLEVSFERSKVATARSREQLPPNRPRALQSQLR